MSGLVISEAGVQARILLKWGAHPAVRLFRTNAGQAWVSTADGGVRPIQMNHPGWADLTGWVTVRGKALFLAIECKSANGRQRETQRHFQDVLVRMGGIYILARSVTDVDKVLESLLREAA